MESGTGLAPSAGAHFTQHASSAHWDVYENMVHAPDWFHLLVLTLLNAHPALTGHLWNQVRPPDWLHLLALSTLIQHSLAPSMESGTRPRLAPPAGAHCTQQASMQHSLAPSMELGTRLD
jgi:hypothetical protein